MNTRETHCDVAGWEVGSSAIGDALGVDHTAQHIENHRQ